MREFDGRGVKKVAVEAQFGQRAWFRLGLFPRCAYAQDTRRTVERIADNRMSNRAHVHSDLVGASGFDVHIQQRELTVWRFDALFHLKVRYGRAAAAAAGRRAAAADGRCAILIRSSR